MDMRLLASTCWRPRDAAAPAPPTFSPKPLPASATYTSAAPLRRPRGARRPLERRAESSLHLLRRGEDGDHDPSRGVALLLDEPATGGDDLQSVLMRGATSLHAPMDVGAGPSRTCHGLLPHLCARARATRDLQRRPTLQRAGLRRGPRAKATRRPPQRRTRRRCARKPRVGLRRGRSTSGKGRTRCRRWRPDTAPGMADTMRRCRDRIATHGSSRTCHMQARPAGDRSCKARHPRSARHPHSATYQGRTRTRPLSGWVKKTAALERHEARKAGGKRVELQGERKADREKIQGALCPGVQGDPFRVGNRRRAKNRHAHGRRDAIGAIARRKFR